MTTYIDISNPPPGIRRITMPDCPIVSTRLYMLEISHALNFVNLIKWE